MRLNKFKQFLTVAGVFGALFKGTIAAAPMPGQIQVSDSFFDVFYDLTALDPAGSNPRGSFFDIFVDLDPGVPENLFRIGHGHGLLLPDPGPTIPIELIAMELGGLGGVMVREDSFSPSWQVRLRESPTRPSLGTTRRDALLGNPPAMVDSFFDVFTELSLDNGNNWQAGDGFFDVFTELSLDGGQTWRNVSVPEGGSTLLLSLIPATLCGWSLYRRRSVAA